MTKPILRTDLIAAIKRSLGFNQENEQTNANNSATDIAIEKLRGANILIVEDNLINQELASALLSSNGMKTTLACNGKEAIDALQQSTFDGVLMDCQMPIMDGYEATKALRKMSQFKSLPILAMTANAMVGDREKALACGMNGHIAKPIRVEELFITMSKWIMPASPVLLPMKKVIKTPNKALINLLPEIPGIDIQTGLNICQNNLSLYLKLLEAFYNNEKQFVDNFRQEFSSNDPQGPCRLAHSLKGSAGNIGANSIQQAAATLELACDEHTRIEEMENELALVNSALNESMQVIQSIDFKVLNDAITKDRDMVLPSQGKKLNMTAELDKLKELLMENNAEAGDQLKHIVLTLNQEDSTLAIEKLGNAIDIFDFDLAIELFNAISFELDD
jgi:CheY-like chemotaxis protein